MILDMFTTSFWTSVVLVQTSALGQAEDGHHLESLVIVNS